MTGRETAIWTVALVLLAFCLGYLAREEQRLAACAAVGLVLGVAVGAGVFGAPPGRA